MMIIIYIDEEEEEPRKTKLSDPSL